MDSAPSAPRPIRAATRRALACFVALAILAVAYRLRLLAAQEDPGEALGRPLVLAAIAPWWLEDLLVGAVVAALTLPGHWLAAAVQPALSARGGAARVLGGVLRHGAALWSVLLVSAVAVCYQTHLGTLQAMGEGLTLSLIGETAATGLLAAGAALIGLLGVGDWLFLVGPALLLLALWWLPARLLRWPLAAVGGAAALATVAAVPAFAAARPPLIDAIRRNPVSFVARDGLRLLRPRHSGWPPLLPADPGRALLAQRAAAGGGQPLADDALAPPRGHRVAGKDRIPFAAQLTSVHFNHPMLVSNVRPKHETPAAAKAERWNVLFVLMESTGLRYAFDESLPGRKAPMPFLARLAARGLQLADHYSPSNSSPRSIFALFTGLYPMPTVRIFSMSKGLYFPSVFSLLPEGYDTFMVTPAPLTWYFPRDLMQRNGPRELVDYNTLPIRGRVPGKAMARDEVATVGHFLQRLDRAGKRPFFGVYYSFVAHWPYPDFGPQYRRYPMTRKLHRYLNNLYLLDTQIERMVKHLEARGLLERTIIVVVGDHGEAFGQHKGNWTHSRHSFNENYQTPAVLFQPRLFRPRKVLQPTSHVDLAPTLLDALGVPHNPQLFQGESLFQDVMRRRYVFLFGNENTLSSVSTEGTKLQLSFRKRDCWAYDLKRDPGETKRLRCAAHPEAYEATVLFGNVQPTLLRAYNDACRTGQPFHGQLHRKPRGATP